MNPHEYINRIEEKYKDTTWSTPINKNLYLDIIEKVVEGYGLDWEYNKWQGTFVICIGLRAAGALSTFKERKKIWLVWYVDKVNG